MDTAVDTSPGREINASVGERPRKGLYNSKMRLRKTKAKAKSAVIDAATAYKKQFKDEWKIIVANLLLTVLIYFTGVLVFGHDLLPMAPAFAVVCLFVSAHILGYAVTLIKLPPIIGNLFAGVILRNLPISPVQYLPSKWAAVIRVTCLSIIFVRSGLELNLPAFKKLGLVALRLTLCPSLTEAFVGGGIAIAFFGMPLFMALTLGFIMAAVGPATVVTGMFALQKQGYGVAKAIPSLLVAAASFDDVLAITGYSLFIGLAVPSKSLAMSVANGFINVGLGIVGGIIGGFFMCPTMIWRKKWLRALGIFSMGQLMMHLFVHFHYKGAGALSSLGMGMVANILWAKGSPRFLSTGPDHHFSHETEAVLAQVWKFAAQPMLFSVIGTALDFSKIQPSTVPLAFAFIFCGLAARMTMAGLVTWGANFNLKERLLIGLGWMPKGSVQAALGAGPLDLVYNALMLIPAWKNQCSNPNTEFRGDPAFEQFCNYEDWAKQILTITVLAIILTTPTGLMIYEFLGPKWLSKEPPRLDDPANHEHGKHETVHSNPLLLQSPSCVALVEMEGHGSDAPHPPPETGLMEGQLQAIDLQLQEIIFKAKQPLDPEGNGVELVKALVAVREQVLKLELKATPVDTESAGNFFRVQELETFWNNTNALQEDPTLYATSGASSSATLADSEPDVEQQKPAPDQI